MLEKTVIVPIIKESKPPSPIFVPLQIHSAISGGPMVAQTHIPFKEEKNTIVFGSWLLLYDIVG